MGAETKEPMLRVALIAVVALGLAVVSLPEAAIGQQTFSTMSTGKVPTPGPTATSWNNVNVYPYYWPNCGGRSGNGSSNAGTSRNCRPYTPGPQPSKRPPKTTGRTQNPPPPAKPATASKPPRR